MPIVHLGGVIDESPTPADWRVLAIPTDWDFESELRIRPVTIDYVTYPDDFFMIIQTAGMWDASAANPADPTAIFVNFKASTTDGIKLVKVHGMGEWVPYLDEVVRHFPPLAWTERAKGEIVKFLQLPGLREQLAATAVPRPESERPADQTAEVGVQRRRKITREHLEEVAKIYNHAQSEDEPPTRAVQNHFGVSHSTAAKWVGSARRTGLLPPIE